MGFSATIVFYLLFGVGVGVAAHLASDSLSRGEEAFRIATAILFWPLYLPQLLERTPPLREHAASPAEPNAPADLSAAIEQAEVELHNALTSLDGWAENVPTLERERIEELRAAWRFQAARVGQLDELLSQPGFAVPAGPQSLPPESPGSSEPDVLAPMRRSEQARIENIARLREMRRKMRDELLSTLIRVRELVTMIHLAGFTGAPSSRAEELVSQIFAAVEGLSEGPSGESGARGTEADRMQTVSKFTVD